MPNDLPGNPRTKSAPLTSSSTPVPPSPTEPYNSSRHRIATETTLALSEWLNAEASGDHSGVFDTPPQTGQFAPLAQAILDCGRTMPFYVRKMFETVIQAREEVLAQLRREVLRGEGEELIRERESVLEK